MGKKNSKRKQRHTYEDRDISLPLLDDFTRASLVGETGYKTYDLPDCLILIAGSPINIFAAPLDLSCSTVVADVLDLETVCRRLGQMELIRETAAVATRGFIETCLHNGAQAASDLGDPIEILAMFRYGLCTAIRLAVFRMALEAALRLPQPAGIDHLTAREWLNHLSASAFLVHMEPIQA